MGSVRRASQLKLGDWGRAHYNDDIKKRRVVDKGACHVDVWGRAL